jgi:hypothetical protein
MKFCSNCGFKLPTGTEKFCPECGFNLTQAGAENYGSSPSVGIKNTGGDVTGVGLTGSGIISGKVVE